MPGQPFLRFFPVGFFGLALLSLACIAAAPAQDLETMLRLERQVQNTYRRVVGTVVSVEAIKGKVADTGSGTVVSADGIILTAAHAIGAATEFLVIFPDGKQAKARVLGANFNRDIGMLKLEGAGPWPHVRIGDSRTIKPAEMLLAMGHAGGFDVHRPPPLRIGRSYSDTEHFLVTDCVLVSGDSGGPLFNLRGEIVAIHSSIGKDLGENIHAPIHWAQESWERMRKGEKWGSLPASFSAQGSDRGPGQ